MKIKSITSTNETLLAENAVLRARLEEAEEMLRAIRAGEVDALVVETAAGPRLFALQGLDAQQNRFRGELLAQVSDTVIATDLDQHITFVNAAAESLFGVRASDVVGKAFAEIYNRQWQKPDLAASIRTALQECGKWRGELILHANDGRVLHVETVFSTLRGPDGEPTGHVAAIRDITERKQAEEALRESNILLDTLLTRAPIGFCMLDRELRYVRINDQLAGFNGIQAAAHVGRTVAEIVPTMEASVRTVTERILQTGEAVCNLEFCGETADAPGYIRYWNESWYPVRGGEGKIIGFGAVVEEITARKKSEEIVARLAAIVESSHDALYGEDLDGIITSWNRGAEQIFGYLAEEIVGTSIMRLMPADLQAAELELQRQIVAGDLGGTFDAIRLTKEGREFPASITIAPLKDAAGKVIGTSRVLRDITERRRVEEALRENAELFSTLIAQAPMGTYVVDAQFRVRQINAEAMPAFGSVHPIIGRDFQEVVEVIWGPDVGGQIADIFRHTLATSERYISPPFTEQRNDLGIEQTYEWETQRVTLPDGQHGVVCYFHEVTERTRATAALRASQERMRLAAEATGVGIWEWNVITNAIRWDAMMFRIYGMEPTPDGFLHYQDWSDAVLPEDMAENEAILQDTIRRSGQSTREFRIRRRSDGECRWIRAVETVRENHEGKAEWVLGTNLDVTDRLVAAQSLRDADRRKDEFLATLAHELRNPLAPMRTAVELLRMKGADIPELQWARDVIDRQTQAMTRLIDDLMDVSRINQGKVKLKREQVELAKIVLGSVETSHPLIEEMGHELTVTLPPGPVIVDADPIRLAQVILNLLNNAAKYTERGGRIDLRAELQGSDVVVSVTDTGIGIPADKLPTLFEMFSQVEGALSRSQGGLGIGLCLVKRLVEMHGGSIEAKSDGPGRGSEFVIRLPIVVEQTYPRPAIHDVENAKLISNLRILVVDDNRDAAESLAMLLTAMGNNVHTAHDGEEAVAAARKFRPDVVLCDIGLPKLNGYEACRRMKEQAWDKKMILVAVTGWGQDEDRRRASEAGFDYHMVKPVNLNNLCNILLADRKLSHTPTEKNGPLRVLIVDDMRDARHMLSTLLKASGHDVQTASDGLTAISVAFDFQPNVVLMDISMPGMSGLEVATQMRLEPKLKDVILIALTGNGDEDDRQRSLEAGFNHHLVKPPDISVIRELLRIVR